MRTYIILCLSRLLHIYLIETMEYRFLGRTGLKVSALSLGGWITYGGHVGEGGQPICDLVEN